MNLPHVMPSLSVAVCLVALASPAAADEGDNQEASPANNAPSAFEQAGAWYRLLQAVPKAGIPLEGLIKPETMGIESQVEASDNEIEMLSGNRMFNGNSATGSISILSGINVHLHITIQREADDRSADAGSTGDRTGSAAKRFAQLDRNGDGQLQLKEYLAAGSPKAHSKKAASKRRRKRRSTDKDRASTRTKQEFRALGPSRKSR